jgi:dTDP-4-amino-4,6-dideoxygalactose transaminase
MSSILTLLKFLCQPSRAGGIDLLDDYQQVFARTITGSNLMPALAFWRGRVALWAILRASGLQEGDEVILPAYTCDMVPIAVKFAGGRCVYVDVEPGGFNPSPQQITDSVTDNTKAIICQHTYGIHQPVHKLAALISNRPMTIIEDCCQLISSDSDHNTVTITGDAAFFSTQWSKPFSTGLGGMAVFPNNKLYAASRDILASFSQEGNHRRAMSLALQLLLYKLTVRPKTKAIIAFLYRWAQRAGIIKGTTTPEEFDDKMPSDYLGGAVNVQAVIGKKQLQYWDENVKRRRILTKFYLDHLSELGIDIVPMKAGEENPALWTVPLFVENVSQILNRAGRLGLPVASWFGPPPAHIVLSHAERLDYKIGQCPRSEWMVAHEIHLLTSPEVTLKQAGDAIKLIKQYGHITNY